MKERRRERERERKNRFSTWMNICETRKDDKSASKRVSVFVIENTALTWMKNLSKGNEKDAQKNTYWRFQFLKGSSRCFKIVKATSMRVSIALKCIGEEGKVSNHVNNSPFSPFLFITECFSCKCNLSSWKIIGGLEELIKSFSVIWNFIPKITVVAEKKTNNKSSTRCQDERLEITTKTIPTHTIFFSTLAHLRFFTLLFFLLNFIFNFSRVKVIFYSETNMIGHILIFLSLRLFMYSMMIHWQHTKSHLLNGRTRRVEKKSWWSSSLSIVGC